MPADDPATLAGLIAARLDRLPSSRAMWSIVALISAGGIFEFYDLFFTAYVAPGMVKTGLFTVHSLGFFAYFQGVALSGFGTFVFCTFAGLWLGVVALGKAADRFGRKPAFIGSLLWYTVSTAVMAFQRSGEAIDLWRLAAGVGFGVQLVTIDSYISELMPPKLRGRAFALNQCIAFAIVPVIALLAWLLVPRTLFGLDGWRVVVLIGSAGAFVVWFLARSIPESPRWLVTHGHLAEAERALLDLESRVVRERGGALPAPSSAVAETLGCHWREMFGAHYRKRTLMLSVFNAAQVIGFYGFNAWVPTLLIARGVNVTSSLEYSFIIALAQPLGPALGTLFADRLERKSQIIAGLVVMGIAMWVFARLASPVALIAVGVAFTLAANIMSYAYHAYQTELYPTRIRAQAIGFVYSWSRIAAAFGGLAVGYLLHTRGVAAVATFIAAVLLIGIVMIGRFGPSTRGLALEDINRPRGD